MKTDNELIAEFMGHSTHAYADRETYFDDPAKRRHFGDPLRERLSVALDLKYHTSWDWLMPVVDKIQSIDIEPAPNYRGYRIEIVVNGYVKISGFPMPSITTNVAGEGSLIAAVYKAVVIFIKWYNSQLATQKQAADSAGNSDSLK